MSLGRDDVRSQHVSEGVVLLDNLYCSSVRDFSVFRNLNSEQVKVPRGQFFNGDRSYLSRTASRLRQEHKAHIDLVHSYRGSICAVGQELSLTGSTR